MPDSRNENEMNPRSLVIPTHREGISPRGLGIEAGAVEYSVGPRFNSPQALQAHMRECLAGWVIEGELEVESGNQQLEAQAGALIYIPRGTLFRWRNKRERPLRWICFFLSGFMEMEFASAMDELRRVECNADRSKTAWGLFHSLCERRVAIRKAS